MFEGGQRCMDVRRDLNDKKTASRWLFFSWAATAMGADGSSQGWYQRSFNGTLATRLDIQ
jgi:hypothetical protein